MVEKEEFDLRVQLGQLAKWYFPTITKVPALEVQRLGDNDYQDSPAHLNALTGTIYIDERVYTFQDKTTRILILHELIHWSLFQENGDADENEGQRFQAEIQRLWSAGAYKNLL
jgi:hypothetical protein